MEFGSGDDYAIDRLLHDNLEDCGANPEPIIRRQFGNRVVDTVLVCTDGTVEDKRHPYWLRG